MSGYCSIRTCTRKRLPRSIVCVHHALEIWDDLIQAGIKTDPLLQQHAAETVAEREQREADESARLAEVRKTEGWVYYLRLDDKLKIGWTSNLTQRLQSYPPHAVMIWQHPGTRADERDLHRTFRPSLAAGREWYHPTDEILAHIEREKAKLPVLERERINPFSQGAA